jgi:acetyl-CoA synthetase
MQAIGRRSGGSVERNSLAVRAQELVARFNATNACAATLLCDSHAPEGLAYRIIRADVTARDLSYGELRAESERFAGALRALGLGPGDRVATLMGKGREYLVALMGIWRLGAVHVPLFTAFAPAAIAFRLMGSAAKVVICDAAQTVKLMGTDIATDAPWRVITTSQPRDGMLGFEALMQASEPATAAALGGNAPVIHIYTSGTTGKPKGVVVPIRALASFQAYAEFALDLRAEDLYWCAADPGWAYGLYFGILSSLTTGTPSVLLEGGFSPETTISALAKHGITNFTAAPTVYRALRTSNLPVPPNLALRCASSAGEVNTWAASALGVPVHDHYGQTEAGMLINNHHHPLLKGPLKSGSMGQVMPGWKAVVLHRERDELAETNEVGRIAMELEGSPLAWFDGYENEPAKSAEKFSRDGRWYLTGDVGSVDDEGYFHFSSRDDDVIISAGYRIGPFEVESVIVTHPDVAECAIIAVPDEIRGEVVEAFVVLRDAASASQDLASELQQWVKTRYAAHAYPRAVHFVDTLPKTPSGKIQRFLLRQSRSAPLEGAAAAS